MGPRAAPQTVQATVSRKLRRSWSPEQIAGWLKRSFPDEEQHRVSHETIYKSLFIQARGVLKKELLEHLRAKRTIRRSRHASLKRDGLGQIKDAIHEYAASGNCYKIRLTAAHVGVPLERRDYDILTGETRTAAFLETVNPNGRIPVLQVGDDFLPENASHAT